MHFAFYLRLFLVSNFDYVKLLPIATKDKQNCKFKEKHLACSLGVLLGMGNKVRGGSSLKVTRDDLNFSNTLLENTLSNQKTSVSINCVPVL